MDAQPCQLFMRYTSRIQRLTYKQLTPSGPAPRLKAKAAQTRNLLPLLVQSCNEGRASLGDKAGSICLAAKELKAIHDIMDKEPRAMSSEGAESFQRSTLRFLHFGKNAGGREVLKTHMLFEIAKQIPTKGNPKQLDLS